jgi:hypothetical protein
MTDRVLRYGWPLLLPLGIAAFAVIGPLFAIGYTLVVLATTAYAVVCALRDRFNR